MSRIAEVILLILTLLVVSPGMLLKPPSAERAPDKSEIERGQYLVEEVAKCQECHTPRNELGELDRSEWLQGAPIWITPVRPIGNWAERAPALAGFPSFAEEQGERILEKGEGPGRSSSASDAHLPHEPC